MDSTSLSPLSAESVAAAGVMFLDLFVADGALHWLELRPGENGRSALVALRGDEPQGLTPPGLSVGSRVYEYGGGAVEVRDGTVFYVDKQDQRIYRQEPDSYPEAITPADARRYGDVSLDPAARRVIAVCEDHRESDTSPPVTIVSVPVEGGEPTTLVGGADFYASPRVSPDGRRLAFVRWQFPNMPWDSTELVLVDLDAPGFGTLVAGGAGVSVCHPVWAPEGDLYYVSDESGWWNIRTDNRPLAPMAAEQGRPGALGRAPYDVSDQHVVFAAAVDGVARLMLADRKSGEVETIDTAGREPLYPRFIADGMAFLGSSPVESPGIFVTDRTGTTREVVRSGMSVDRPYLATPESLTVPTRDGAETHAFFYPPLDGARPAPLMVMVHGGPVGATSSALRGGNNSAQFWTSRGYAVVDVNYRGSTGYGRGYREALYHRWGELEVDDCIDVADYLVDRGDADRSRIVIRGGSAGGFTTLAALAFRDYFAAGTAYFPVSDLVAFHGSTHKFEAQYDEQLIGPWDEDEFWRRSPISRVADITAPLLLIQGLEDRVCPPEQSELMVTALTELGRPVEYLTFPDEGHGFTKAGSIIRSLETEADFYSRALKR